MQAILRRRDKESRRQDREASYLHKEGQGTVDRNEMQTISRRRDKESRRQARESSNPQKEGHKEL